MLHHRESVPVSPWNNLTNIRCIRDAASMLCLSQTGVMFHPDIVEAQWAKVAAVAEEFGASPEDIQQALEFHEPALAVQAERG